MCDTDFLSTNETKLLIIIPAYNEEGSIKRVIESLTSELPDSVILVVDDCSNDETFNIASETDALVIHLRHNLGIGGAVQTGLKYAQKYSFDVAVQFDGDGQHIASEVSKLLNPILQNQSDISLGSRWLESYSFESSKSRRAGMRVLSTVIFLKTGLKFTDPTSGFRAFNKKAILKFSGEYPKDFPEVEVLIESHIQGLRVEEVPVSMNVRTSGKSSITFMKSIYYMLLELLMIFITPRKDSK